MYARTLITTLALLALTGCKHGVKPTPAAPSRSVSISLDEGALAPCPTEYAQPLDGRQSSLLVNHTEVMGVCHACAINHNALVRGLYSQKGITINGLEHAPDAAASH